PVLGRRVAEDALPHLRAANEFAEGHEVVSVISAACGVALQRRRYAASGDARSHLDVRFRVGPLAALLLELAAAVDDDLAIVADTDLPALQRPGGRALEVDAADVEAGAVTGALELLLALQPVRRAAEVRAGRAQRVDDALVLDDPGVLVLEALDDLALLQRIGVAGLELRRRLGQHVGDEEAQ